MSDAVWTWMWTGGRAWLVKRMALDVWDECTPTERMVQRTTFTSSGEAEVTEVARKRAKAPPYGWFKAHASAVIYRTSNLAAATRWRCQARRSVAHSWRRHSPRFEGLRWRDTWPEARRFLTLEGTLLARPHGPPDPPDPPPSNLAAREERAMAAAVEPPDWRPSFAIPEDYL